MTLGQRLLLALAVLVALFGFVMISGALIGVLEGDSGYTPTTNLVLSVLLGVIPLAGGVLLFSGVRRNVARRRAEAEEAAVLRVARGRGGVVSAVDVAADCGIGLDEAQTILDRLHLRGHAEMDVAPTGTVVYRVRL
jgi:hypothetical protein